jgi:hypothetical protein
MIPAPLWIAPIVLGIAGFAYYSAVKSGREVIEGVLRRRGMQDIKIEHDWFDFDRDTLTFDVAYRDAAGLRHSNSAKIHHRAMRGGGAMPDDIYWQRPF